MEERKINSGVGCFLVKDESLRDGWDAPLYQWLKDEGFQTWGRKGTFLGVDWIFININSKVYAPGVPGIGVAPVIGEHAITLDEFMTVYQIFKKYQGLPLLKMPKTE